MTEARSKGEHRTELANGIVKCIKDGNISPGHTPGYWSRSPFSWGKDADNAVYNAVVMEQIAKIFVFGQPEYR